MLVEKVYALCDTSNGVDIKSCFSPAQKFNNLGDVVNSLSSNVIIIAGVIFFALILIAGFGVITAAGSEDAKALEKNKSFLTYAIIGFVIIFSAFWIVQIINFVTGGSLGGLFK